MSDLIETINYRGYNIEVCYDTNPIAPDEWDNTDNFLLYEHRDFTVKVKGFEGQDIFDAMQAKKPLFEGYFYFPVYAYIHSGVSLSLGRNFIAPGEHLNWDVSFKGFVMVKRQKGVWTREQAYKLAQGTIQTWNQYLSGDVYGYNSEAGGCWGFYGAEGRKEMIKEAKNEIDYAISKKISEHLKQVKTWILNRVPLLKRSPLTVA